MDTPQKITYTPLSKFEDSPIFNYINSLSPIKPVKSLHIGQTSFQSLSLASLSSVFTSPHVSSSEEPKYLARLSKSHLLELQSSSENGNKVPTDPENFEPGISNREQAVEPLQFAVELPRKPYDCGSADQGNTNALAFASILQGSENGASAGDLPLQQPTCQVEQKKDVVECDWENLIADVDLFFFNSPVNSEALKELMQKSPNPNAIFCASLDEVSRMQHAMEYSSTQPGEVIELKETDPSLENCEDFDNNMKENHGAVSNLYRGMRRRCLDFETVGGRRKKSDENSSSSSYNASVVKNVSQNKQLVPLKTSADSSMCMLPGIGLHLNALAITPADSKNIKHETLPSGISVVRTSTDVDESLTVACNEKDINSTKDVVLLSEDVQQAEGYLFSEELNPSSPRKKKRRAEGEGEACKRCNCKKSKCLKLYCECFAAGVYCIEPCACQDCQNKPIHEDIVLATRKQIESRNPLAFAPKVIRNSDPVSEIGDDASKTPASARHKRGCNCKKSGCLKKYCECYQGGVGCSVNCRCEGCKNAFGRKDGSVVMEAENVAEGQPLECEKMGMDIAPQIADLHNTEEQNPDSAFPATPLQLCGSLVPLPYPSTGNQPQPLISIGSSSALYTNQKYGKPNIIRPPPKVENQFQAVPDDDLPEILRDNYMSYSGIVKSSSPNSKRVSPPSSNFGSSPNRRGGRKLILHLIPSFPSLTPQH